MTGTVAKGIVRSVSEEIGRALSFSYVTHGGAVICTDAKGFRYAIICYSGPDYVVKGVVRERRKGRAFNWLCNGQAGSGAIQIARWDESHRYYVTLAEFI
jgi:hypothetical protein